MPTAPDPDGRPVRLLFMCTANQCRSPMAEVIAVRQLAERGVVAQVASCGVLEGGMPAAAGAVRAVAGRDMDLSGHVSRIATPELLGHADLIVTMERHHLVEIARLDMELVGRSFTLRELARAASLVGPRRPDEPAPAWVARAAAARDPAAVLTQGTADDVADPMGRSRRAFRRTAEELEELIADVLWQLFPRWADGPGRPTAD
jgi:protein-tyrosine phosphatase